MLLFWQVIQNYRVKRVSESSRTIIYPKPACAGYPYGKETPMFMLNRRNFQSLLVILFVVIAVESSEANWVQRTEVPTSRNGTATAVVNGKIYIIGGVLYSNKSGPGWSALSMVEVYDTRTGAWGKAADMPTPRIAAQAAVFAGEIYVFGGYSRGKIRGEKDHKTVEVYNTRTNTWSKTRDMPTLRRGFGTAVVDGKIYVIGGAIYDKQRDVRVATDLVEAYDPLTERWKKHASMPTERMWIDTEVVNNKIYAIGGEVSPRHGVPDADQFFARIEEYNPRTDRWRKRPDMPLLRFSFSTVAIDKKIYLIGGYTRDNGFKTLTSIDVYEPSLNRWGTIPPLPTPKIAPAVAVNGVIYVLGGFIRGQRFSHAVEAFDTGFRAVNPKGKLSTLWGKLKKSN